MAEAAKNILSRVDFLQLIPHKCSVVTTLLPSLQEESFVGISQTRSGSAGTRVRDGSGGEPPLNGSLGHTQLESHLGTVQTAFLQFQNVLIPSHSLGLTGQLCLCNGSPLGWTPEFRWGLLHLLRPDGRSLRPTKLSEVLGKHDRDTSSKILYQMPAIPHFSSLGSAFFNR